MQIKCIKSRIKIIICLLCFKMSETRRKIFFNYDCFFLFLCVRILISTTTRQPKNGKSKSSFVSTEDWLDFEISCSKGRKYFVNYSIEILRLCYRIAINEQFIFKFINHYQGSFSEQTESWKSFHFFII